MSAPSYTPPAVLTVDHICAIQRATAPNSRAYGKIKSRRAHLRHLCHFSHTFPVLDSCPSTLPPLRPTLHPSLLPLLGFIPPSPLCHLNRNQFRPAASHRHGMLAKGDGVRSGFSATTFSLPPFCPPSSDLFPLLHHHRRYFTAFPQLAWYRSGLARQLDRTAPENLCGVISHIM